VHVEVMHAPMFQGTYDPGHNFPRVTPPDVSYHSMADDRQLHLL
jgi:hypothetical protein